MVRHDGQTHLIDYSHTGTGLLDRCMMSAGQPAGQIGTAQIRSQLCSQEVATISVLVLLPRCMLGHAPHPAGAVMHGRKMLLLHRMYFAHRAHTADASEQLIYFSNLVQPKCYDAQC